MDEAKKKRTPLRTSFTKTISILNSEAEKDEVDKSIISDNFSNLENLISEIAILDASILDFVAEYVKFEEGRSFEYRIRGNRIIF